MFKITLIPHTRCWKFEIRVEDKDRWNDIHMHRVILKYSRKTTGDYNYYRTSQYKIVGSGRTEEKARQKAEKLVSKMCNEATKDRLEYQKIAKEKQRIKDASITYEINC